MRGGLVILILSLDINSSTKIAVERIEWDRLQEAFRSETRVKMREGVP